MDFSYLNQVTIKQDIISYNNREKIEIEKAIHIAYGRINDVYCRK